MVKSVTGAKPSESEDVIELQIGKKPWKAKLSKEVAVFVASSGDDALFARRDEVHFISKGKVAPRQTRNVSVQIGKRTFSGRISPESMVRYEAWKEIPAERREVRKEALAEVSSKSRLATTLLAFLEDSAFIDSTWARLGREF